MSDIPIAFDSTDHFVLLCPNCGETMHILKVTTIKAIIGMITPQKGKFDKCTQIMARCPKCKSVGARKIYWHENNSDHECVVGGRDTSQ